MKLLELIWILFIQGVTSLRIVNFDVPRHAIEGDDVRLRCDYDLEGETLYSVKWYWNGREFYRYIPTDDPTTTVFSSPELRIQENKSKENDVFISKVNTNSTGIFRCEVSAEAPVFQTASAEDIFIVVILPDQPGPVIAGSKPKYSLGDNLLVSCSASNSFPATNLTWFINGNHADPAYIEVDEHLKTSDGKFTARSYLRLHINDHHTKLGKIKLKCGASIPSVYWKSVEVSIEINQTEDIIEQDEITIKDEKSWSFFKGGGQTIQSSSWTLIWLLTSYVIIY